MVFDQMSAKDPRAIIARSVDKSGPMPLRTCKLFYCLGHPCQGFIHLSAATYCDLISHVVLCGMSMAV